MKTKQKGGIVLVLDAVYVRSLVSLVGLRHTRVHYTIWAKVRRSPAFRPFTTSSSLHCYESTSDLSLLFMQGTGAAFSRPFSPTASTDTSSSVKALQHTLFKMILASHRSGQCYFQNQVDRQERHQRQRPQEYKADTGTVLKKILSVVVKTTLTPDMTKPILCSDI